LDQPQLDRIARLFSRTRSRRAMLGIAAGVLSGAVARRASTSKAQLEPPGSPGRLVSCGGYFGTPCPPNHICVDDPSDSCDPNAFGADCPGICIPVDPNVCAAILCPFGTTCCPVDGGSCLPFGTPCAPTLGVPCDGTYCAPGLVCCNNGCGECAAPDGACSAVYCEPTSGTPCGQAWCGEGEYCCNESCSMCAPIGAVCTQQFCFPDEEIAFGEPCGPVTCEIGEVCCNASCGICTPPDGVCIQIACI